MDQWLRLDEDQAKTAFGNWHNAERLQRVLPWMTLLACGVGFWEITQGRYGTLLLPLVDLVLIRILFVTREHRRFEPRIQWILVAFFMAQLVLLRSLFWEHVLHPIDAVFPLAAALLPTAGRAPGVDSGLSMAADQRPRRVVPALRERCRAAALGRRP